MKIVIDIPNELYNEYVNIQLHNGKSIVSNLLRAIQNGTPLPDHHGRIIDESQIRHIVWRSEPELYGDRIIYVKETDAPTIIEGSESE